MIGKKASMRSRCRIAIMFSNQLGDLTSRAAACRLGLGALAVGVVALVGSMWPGSRTVAWALLANLPAAFLFPLMALDRQPVLRKSKPLETKPLDTAPS